MTSFCFQILCLASHCVCVTDCSWQWFWSIIMLNNVLIFRLCFPEFYWTGWLKLLSCCLFLVFFYFLVLLQVLFNFFQGKWQPLHTLAASGEFYLVNALLKHNVDINIQDKVCRTVIMIYVATLHGLMPSSFLFFCFSNFFCMHGLKVPIIAFFFLSLLLV